MKLLIKYMSKYSIIWRLSIYFDIIILNGGNEMKKVLGLDIGITSVGYGVIDIDENKFLDYGVRLFKEGTAENNLERRTNRGARRLRSRKKNRIEDMKNLLQQYQILDVNYTPSNNPYQLRVKGLQESLTNDELTNVILHITKKRGSSLETIEDNEEAHKENEKTKDILNKNAILLKEGKYICQIQLARLQEEGRVKGEDNNFKTTDYLKELHCILDNQKIDEQLKQKILQIVSRRRKYYEGPGSKISPTPYGRYFINNGKLEYVDLIEKMRGKCSVYPQQLRAPKMSYSAELFNLLNDLNNLTIDQQNKLTLEQKEKIIEIVHHKGNITPKQLASFLNVPIENITGFRVDKNNKQLLTECKGYKIIKKVFESHDNLNLIADKQVIDNLAEVLTKNKGIEERYRYIYEKYPMFDKKLLKDLANIRGISGYHSLSLKAIKELNVELLNTELNQMQLIHQLEMSSKHRNSTKGKKNIVGDEKAILSPVVQRAQRETFKVVNKLRKIHGEFDTIVIETTRDKNSQERKKRINQTQKYYETKNKEITSLLEQKGFDVSTINAKTKLKVRLYLEQEGKSAYTLQPLDLHRVINDSTYCEIDHIIPISVSLDDSLNNKVLATHQENQIKGNLSPMMAYMKNVFSDLGCTIQTYKTHVRNSKMSRKKKEYLLDERDITKYDTIKQFINRNLVDTSYTNRVVMNTLTNYFRDNGIHTKVHTVRGSATDKIRKTINLRKDRDENYLHHAIDALIVASIKKMNLFNTYLSKYNIDDLYDEKTGEVFKIPETDTYLESKYIDFITTLKNIYAENVQYLSGVKKKQDMQYGIIKVSHKIDTKPNRKFADETIYSTRNSNGKEMVIGTYRDIYDPKLSYICEDIINGNESKYLMHRNDIQSFSIIKDIILDHYHTYKASDEFYVLDKKGKVKLKGINPLTLHREMHGYIHKYAKKNNGPIIKSMKYYDHVIGNCIDITKNYQAKNKKVLLKQISPYRTDFYQAPNGKYTMVTVRYKDVKYDKTTKMYTIDKVGYENQKKNKKISSEYRFICSLHHDELLGITKKAGSKMVYSYNDAIDICHDGITPEIVKYTATNDDGRNIIEVKPLACYCSKQLRLSIGTIIKLEKYACDILGNLYKITENVRL